ncbi:unnamed protein product [Moneuplotes crassus]|uniref:Palmitoyltransferase n=1 Tax=Euplotes crassus TaxID=5936 RepID=A0AAD2D624_EUPCR|nr:unnamed protein product [Moneuplotes crassus]
MAKYENVKTNDSVMESDLETKESEEEVKLRKIIKEVKEHVAMKDRKLPRIFGKTIVLYQANNQAVLTIGPHIGFTICLFVTIIAVSIGAIYLASLSSGILALVGAIIGLLLLIALGFTALVAPGHPSLEVTEEDLKLVEQDHQVWCKICKVIKRKGDQHCSECYSCVEGMDHHCPWMGKCVGKGNLAFFDLFIILAGVYFIFLFATVISYLVATGDDS